MTTQPTTRPAAATHHGLGDAHAIVIRRTIHAPPERVFEAWSDPDVAARWSWGAEYTTEHVELDCRPGGTWRQTIARKDTGKQFHFSGEYLEVDPPHLVVFTFAWHTNEGPEDGPSVVRVELRAHAEGTEVVLTHQGVPANKVEGTTSGWDDCFGEIERVLFAAPA